MVEAFLWSLAFSTLYVVGRLFSAGAESGGCRPPARCGGDRDSFPKIAGWLPRHSSRFRRATAANWSGLRAYCPPLERGALHRWWGPAGASGVKGLILQGPKIAGSCRRRIRPGWYRMTSAPTSSRWSSWVGPTRSMTGRERPTGTDSFARPQGRRERPRPIQWSHGYLREFDGR